MFNMSDMYCSFHSCSQSLPQEPPLAYSYVPMQCLKKVYDWDKALCRGTLFPELDKPMCVYGYEFKEKCEEDKKDNCIKNECIKDKCMKDECMKNECVKNDCTRDECVKDKCMMKDKYQKCECGGKENG